MKRFYKSNKACIDWIWDKTGVPRDTIRFVLLAEAAFFRDQLCQGQEVGVHNLGIMRLEYRKGRMIKNPFCEDPVQHPSAYYPRFRVCSALRKKVLEAQKLHPERFASINRTTTANDPKTCAHASIVRHKGGVRCTQCNTVLTT